MLLKQLKKTDLEFFFWYRIYACPNHERATYLQYFIKEDESVYELREGDSQFINIAYSLTSEKICGVKLEAIESILDNLCRDIGRGKKKFSKVRVIFVRW